MALLRRGKKIGEGSYGAVYEAQLPGPRATMPLVVKRNFSEHKTPFIQNIREADILNTVKGHPHIIEILHYASPASFDAPLSPRSSIDESGTSVPVSDDQIHFVFSRCDGDLHNLQAAMTGVPKYAAIMKYMVHMLLGLEYIHQKGIVHFDIKPANILINSKMVDAMGNVGVAKICDFGLARPFTYQENLGTNLCTSIFRPPELMLWRPNIDFKVDIWSMACCFFQAITRRHYIPSNFNLIHPELCEDDALLAEYIKCVPGGLSTKHIRMIKYNDSRTMPQFKWPEPGTNPKSYQSIFGLSESEKCYFESQAGLLDDLCDLMEHMLCFDPSQRFSATECLNHKFFKQHSELISRTRGFYPAENTLEQKIYSYPCVERTWGSEWMLAIRLANKNVEWYHDRIMFRAWDLYEKYLYIQSGSINKNSFAVESDLKGLIHSRTETYLVFAVCLYISIKYFRAPHIPQWNNLVKQLQVITGCEMPANSQYMGGQLELGIIISLNYNVYENSVYEAADWYQKKHSPTDLTLLMLLVTRCPNLHGRKISAVYKHYIDHLQTFEVERFNEKIVWPD